MCPARIHSAAARPTPGPKMIPCEFRPAATNRPGTSGTNPSWRLASGVKLSGPRRNRPKPEVGERRHPGSGRSQHRADVVPVGPELDEAVGRHARGRPRLAVRLERTDHEAPTVMTDVQVAVEVAQERQVLGGGGRLVGHDPDVLGWIQRDARVGEARQLRRPEASGQDDDLRLDGAGGRLDAGDAAPIRPRRNPVTDVPGT